ncbi:hypothetical protein BpHYR1_007512 [Brachionus plicatilis]|uniref:Uncharacterized protein n=1 Tax=Brachionus plicatilis TaxID=10195 RepID=A0A3M7QML9_BRAPC|nr:hypothetical protein BpHYR1_007512 [Brachionus plicatilis]
MSDKYRLNDEFNNYIIIGIKFDCVLKKLKKINLNPVRAINKKEVLLGHVDFVIKCSQKNKNVNYLFFFVMCNLNPFSFFISSPHMLKVTGFGCLFNAFFVANLASSEVSTNAVHIHLDYNSLIFTH